MVIRYAAGLALAGSEGTPFDVSRQPPAQYAEDGSVVADFPRSDSEIVPPPPPATWLLNALGDLSRRYPNDRIEAFMRYTPVDQRRNCPLPKDSFPASEPPDYIQFRYVPRVKCLDCAGKLYVPGPGKSLENFEVHLKTRMHRERAQKRLNASKENEELPKEEGKRAEVSNQHVEPANESDICPPTDSPPPPPEWLVSATNELRQKEGFKFQKFKPMMRWTKPANSPNDRMWQAVPMILCDDCFIADRFHMPGPDQSLGDFEAHFNTGIHRKRACNRIALKAFRERERKRREEEARAAQSVAHEEN